MTLTQSYLITVKNLEAFFDGLMGAKAPETFTYKFIENLGFTSSNDRLYLSVLKGLGFLDENAIPTDRYFKFMDQSESKKVLAEAIEEAYGELFAVKTDAQNLEVSEVKNKLKTITQGKHSDKVVGLMANTFKALCDYAEWNKEKGPGELTPKKKEVIDVPEKQDEKLEDDALLPPTGDKLDTDRPDFHYNIQIHLPDSRDESVYDAIFKSLKKHLF